MAGHEASGAGDDELTLLGLGSILLRSRRMIMVLGVVGGVVGLAAGLLSKRLYVSSATFIPQSSDNSSTSGIALAASQFGIRLPGNSSAWGPPVYVELLRSRTLLETIAHDTLTVAEEGNRRIPVADLLEIEDPNPAERTERTIRALTSIIGASEDKRLGAVRLSVTTRWPSVSLALADQLISGLNKFILMTRKSQATAERQFVETQSAEAERALREAEDRLQVFLQVNRVINSSPALQFQRERLQRDVTLRQQVYASLAQSREDARIREVRETPVITVLQPPRMPVMGEARNSIKKALLGGFAGVVVGALIAFMLHAIATTRQESTQTAREFFRLVEEAMPRFLRRRARA